MIDVAREVDALVLNSHFGCKEKLEMLFMDEQQKCLCGGKYI